MGSNPAGCWDFSVLFLSLAAISVSLGGTTLLILRATDAEDFYPDMKIGLHFRQITRDSVFLSCLVKQSVSCSVQDRSFKKYLPINSRNIQDFGSFILSDDWA